MRNTNLYNEWKALDNWERRELAAAVKAHGGEYIFIDCENDDAEDNWYQRDDKYDLPIVNGSTDYMEVNEDMYVSRVKVDDGGLTIYGFCKDGGSPDDEDEITFIAYSHISFITDCIPETDTVKEVSEPDKSI